MKNTLLPSSVHSSHCTWQAIATRSRPLIGICPHLVSHHGNATCEGSSVSSTCARDGDSCDLRSPNHMNVHDVAICLYDVFVKLFKSLEGAFTTELLFQAVLEKVFGRGYAEVRVEKVPWCYEEFCVPPKQFKYLAEISSGLSTLIWRCALPPTPKEFRV